jgi:hypothetical protein
MSIIDESTFDKAAAYVCKHGQYMREGVYGVRYPQCAPRAIFRVDTHELTAEVAKRMAEGGAA